MRNSIDTVKNDMARQKCEFEREKKKIQNDHENIFACQRREIEEERDSEIRSQNTKNEKFWKKKSDDREKEIKRKIT
jgi:hypothetical protein